MMLSPLVIFLVGAVSGLLFAVCIYFWDRFHNEDCEVLEGSDVEDWEMINK